MLSISMITSSFIYGKQFYFISIFILSEIRKLYFHFRGRKRFFFFDGGNVYLGLFTLSLFSFDHVTLVPPIIAG